MGNMENNKNYTISEVSELTGATEFILRTWELRYKIVQPRRTKTARRLYSDHDVMKISKILLLTQHGFKISQLAQLGLEDLNQLELGLNISASYAEASQPMSHQVEKVFKFLPETNYSVIKDIFFSQRQKLDPSDYIQKFIIPISQEMSRQSLNRTIDIIQEHIISSLIKENLYAMTSKPMKKLSAYSILFATAEGDHHDLGLLLSKVLAEAAGFQTIYLGSHVPKKELSEACIRLRPTHVVIGTNVNSHHTAKDHLLKYIHFIDQHIPHSTALWLGGFAAQELVLNLKRPFHIFKSMNEYENELTAIKKAK